MEVKIFEMIKGMIPGEKKWRSLLLLLNLILFIMAEKKLEANEQI